MKKYIICFILLFSFCLPNSHYAFAADKVPTRTSASVAVDGEYELFLSYNIDGNNYFKLRDIAYVLSGTPKQFEVIWNEKYNTIELQSGKAYTPVGGEMKCTAKRVSKAVPTSSSLLLDGKPITATAYNIDGNNYFKLRDLGKALDFSVEWFEKDKIISIISAYGYTEEGNDTYALKRDIDISTNQTTISNWGSVSELQQFKYKNEGLAYAYEEDSMLNIVTPNNNFQIKMKYPLLGDVISDDDGNFYVVWGQENKNDNYDTQTVFISKYSSSAVHVKTTGFPGESIMGKDGNTQIPFAHGNCDSAIANGYLMVNYARRMYNGHQSNNVIGVKLSNMSPVKFDSVWDIPYCSHSFNQEVIWSKKSNGFVYADHGDAYDRGFVISTDSDAKNIFNFYLESNANYDMFIVNKTFAQLGGLLETSKGVVLVGASAKSISEKAKEQPQNLFVQIFNPNATKISASMFVGGETRNGETSFDINDNKNSPLTPVTNYGVHWITNHNTTNVIAPHAVEANDKIVILWNARKNDTVEAYYTVLSSDGTTLKAPTSLGVGRSLNSYEDPIYHNGSVYWSSVSYGVLRVESIKID